MKKALKPQIKLGLVRQPVSFGLWLKQLFHNSIEKNKADSVLIGKIAVTETDLSPSGTALIDGEVYEVKTDGEFVEAGRGVKVTRVSGKKIFVKRV